MVLLFKVAGDPQQELSRRNGIGLGVVMVQVAADVGGKRAELVVGQIRPSLAGQIQGALVMEDWRRNLEVLQQGIQHAQVEASVVRDDEIGGC